MEFHIRVAELAGSPGLLRAIEREQVLIFNWFFDTAAQQKSLPANFHRDLAVALCSEEPAGADAAMRNHVRYGMSHIADNLAAIEVSRGWRLKRTS
jgi:DNA-binding GntR family transcriptional regulator